jgi:hypothetical protein
VPLAQDASAAARADGTSIPGQVPTGHRFAGSCDGKTELSANSRKGVILATRDLTEGTVGQRAERAGVRLTGRRDETKWAPLTTEFWAMLGVIGATLVAAVVADNFEAPRAWLIVGVVATGYIVSRGLAKAGNARSDADATRGF